MSSREIIFSAAGAAGAPATYIEDVFSTWLTTGAGSNITVNNGIDLAGKGGLVWNKTRNTADFHTLFDTARGANYGLFSNATNAQSFSSNWLPTFNSNGFVIGTDNNLTTNGTTGVSWTFRKQPKFFDVVTYTGTGSNTLQVSHSLGSTPGMVIYKRTDSTSDWCCLNRANNGGYEGMYLNKTDSSLGNSGSAAGAGLFSTYVKPGEYWGSFANTNGATYVAYLFAHDAGGFGLSGTDNVISCGSFTTNATTGLASVNLGWEPQYVLIKSTSRSGTNWLITDSMRGMTTNSDNRVIYAELSNAEATTATATPRPNSTGFSFNWINGALGADTFIYMAIRRGPMKTPTSGTSVFSPIASTASTGTKLTTNFPIDLQISNYRPYGSNPAYFVDRLRGASSTDTDGGRALTSTSIAAEVTSPALARFWDNTGFKLSGYYGGADDIFWNFRRAPGFMDVVCYTGTGSATTVTHNLGVAPELMIVKSRSNAEAWWTYAAPLGNTKYLRLNTTDDAFTYSLWNNTTPTSSVFSVSNDTNYSNYTYVAYLFATIAGVSKVGSYTGTGSTLNINAGLPTGARFVLIKRTDSTGDWWVWDTARGMVSGTDPRLALNSTAAEVNNNWVYTVTNGFQIVTTDATVNASGGSYIYLAIA